MLVYGHRTFRLNLRRFLDAFAGRLARLPALPRHDTIVGLLVDFGEAACAHADACSPVCDEECDELEMWSAGTRSIAAALHASWHGDAARARRELARGEAIVRTLAATAPPADLEARTGEGFAMYGLYPEQYIEAAARLYTVARPARVLCIGLRSIGYTLAHVVCAALAADGVAVSVRSARPRGHPFDRHLALGPRLTQRMACEAYDLLAIVDEGPGLSGSSFAGAVAAARDAGVAPERIVLLPGWNAPADTLRSESARRAWTSHRKIQVPFETVWPKAGRAPFDAPVVEISAGAWRAHAFADADRGDLARATCPRSETRSRWPAAHPQHERRKYLSVCAGRTTVFRFAGLGRYGERAAARAALIADAGFTAAPARLIHGFLERPWLPGTPGHAAARRTPAFVNRVAEYLAFLSRTFRADEADDVSELSRMMAANAAEALGIGWERAIDLLSGAARPFAECRVALDGRMLPHEWIISPAGAFKVDELDHHADDFFPGCRDIAWDLAGAIEEFGLDDHAAAGLVLAFRRKSGDATIARRLPFYRAAYLAYRVGYASLAAESLGASEDGARFTALTRRYRRSLAERLSRCDPGRRR